MGVGAVPQELAKYQNVPAASAYRRGGLVAAAERGESTGTRLLAWASSTAKSTALSPPPTSRA